MLFYIHKNFPEKFIIYSFYNRLQSIRENHWLKFLFSDCDQELYWKTAVVLKIQNLRKEWVLI